MIKSNTKFIKKNLEYFKNNNFKYKNFNFFKELVESMPSFKKSYKISNSEKMSEFNKNIYFYLQKYHNKEKGLISLSKKAKILLNKLNKVMSSFLEKIEDLEILKGFGERFELPYIDLISNSKEKFKNFFGILKKENERQYEIFNSEFFDFLKFQSLESSNFLKVLKKKNNFISKLEKIENSFKTTDFEIEKKILDLKIFKNYLDFSTHYNFKHFFIHKNLKINYLLEKNVNKNLDFYSNVIL